MQLHLESRNKNTIQAYSHDQVQIEGQIYQESLLIMPTKLLCPWPVRKLDDLNEENLSPILAQNPNIVLIAHQDITQKVPHVAYQFFAKHQIALEYMSIGAACRTFNILLSEDREVMLGIIYLARA